jgi:hypothetical protein
VRVRIHGTRVEVVRVMGSSREHGSLRVTRNDERNARGGNEDEMGE